MIKGQETTGTICRVAGQLTQDDATSHGVARSQMKGCACLSRRILIGAGDRYGRQTLRRPEYRQGGGRTAIWQPMICEAARPTADDPSSCHRLLLLLMYLCLLVECHLHDGAGRLAPRAVLLALPSQLMAVSRGSRPTLHAGDWQRCWSTLRRSIESDAARQGGEATVPHPARSR
jgi:hypothetical protein